MEGWIRELGLRAARPRPLAPGIPSAASWMRVGSGSPDQGSPGGPQGGCQDQYSRGDSPCEAAHRRFTPTLGQAGRARGPPSESASASVLVVVPDKMQQAVGHDQGHLFGRDRRRAPRPGGGRPAGATITSPRPYGTPPIGGLPHRGPSDDHPAGPSGRARTSVGPSRSRNRWLCHGHRLVGHEHDADFGLRWELLLFQHDAGQPPERLQR